MVEVKIFNDGKLVKQLQGQIVMFTLLNKNDNNSIKATGGLVGLGPVDLDQIGAFAYSSVENVISSCRGDAMKALLATAFAAAVDDEVKKFLFKEKEE